jgi:DNA-binding LacI/PurR family transcriptional regulator
LASYVLPELTTVAQPITQMAERAVNRLLLLIQEHLVRLAEDPELKPQCMVLPTCLIVRNSTVAPQGVRFGRSASPPKHKTTQKTYPKHKPKT